MRALALHPDVLVVSSAVLHVNCVIVRGGAGTGGASRGGAPGDRGKADGGPLEVRVSGGPSLGETFVIDSPVLPDELDALPTLIEQARFPAAAGLLATHADWDHLLGRLAFPELALGCAESTAERLAGSAGEAQRTLRRFDEELMIERVRPLALGAVQTLPVPGYCEVGARELELHPTGGHTIDGMAVWIGWAGVLVAGDYLSGIEVPTLHDGDVETYLASLERLRPLVQAADHVVPGHGPVLDSVHALTVLDEDAAYLQALREKRAEAELPAGRRGAVQRELHAKNVAAL